MLRLFEYAVILQPKEDRDGDIVEQGKVVVEPKTVLCESEEQAQLVAGRSIPEEFISELDRLTLVVRPF